MLAKHKLVDFYGCDPNFLDEIGYLEAVMRLAASKAGCKFLALASHKFEPQGVTVMVLVAESHFSIHTWPEKKQALVDVFASGDIDLNLAIEYIGKSIGATSSVITHVQRG